MTQHNLTPEEARAIAKETYIFAFPLVMYYRTMYLQAVAEGHQFGEWLHLGISAPQDTDIVTPNNDTPYSYAWLDLRAEPWVLTLPQVEADRYITSQWNDLLGYVLDNPGSVLDGNNGVNVMFVSPDWQGNMPAGIKRIIRGETPFVGSLSRTQLLDVADLARVQEIQASYQLQPLSAYLNQPALPTAPRIDWPVWVEGAETTDDFWRYINFLLAYVAPHPDDKPMHDRLAAIGVKAGAPWPNQNLAPKLQVAVKQGLEDAQAELDRLSKSDFNPSDFFGTRDMIGLDYVNRALGVYVGIFGNWPTQAVYLAKPTDANGEVTDGSKASYTLTFPAGNLPPVKYFWSMTMYRLPQRWLVDNAIDRYSIGSKTPGLQQSPDGSLTIYISANSPGNDKESNWLPAPEGPFWIVLRTYGPSQELIDGAWQRPELVP